MVCRNILHVKEVQHNYNIYITKKLINPTTIVLSSSSLHEVQGADQNTDWFGFPPLKDSVNDLGSWIELDRSERKQRLILITAFAPVKGAATPAAIISPVSPVSRFFGEYATLLRWFCRLTARTLVAARAGPYTVGNLTHTHTLFSWAINWFLWACHYTCSLTGKRGEKWQTPVPESRHRSQVS